MTDSQQGGFGLGRIIAVILLILVVAAFVIRFLTMTKETAPLDISSVRASEGQPVEIVRVARGDLETWMTLAGTVEGITQYPIVSQNRLEVLSIAKREGERVEAGDVIIRLANTAPSPMYHSREKATARLKDARRNVERMRNLYAEGAVSQQALDRAEMSLELAEADLRDAVESTDLVATADGVVTIVLVEPGDAADSGKPIAWVARLDSVRVVFEAGSRQALELELGQVAVLSPGGFREAKEGMVTSLDLAADPRTHLLTGEIVFANEDRLLLPGVLVSFRVQTAERRQVLHVPTECLINRSDEVAVYVVNQDGAGTPYAKLQPVVVGLVTPDNVEISQGLSEDDVVIRFGLSQLADGDKVKAVAVAADGED